MWPRLAPTDEVINATLAVDDSGDEFFESSSESEVEETSSNEEKPIPQLRQTPMQQMEEDNKRGGDQAQGERYLESS